MRADFLVPAPEQADEQRKLNTGNKCSRQDDDRAKHQPLAHFAAETEAPKRLQEHGQRGDAISKGKRDRQTKSFKGTGEGEELERRPATSAKQSVAGSAEANAKQRYGEDHPKGKSRTAQQRAEHSVPHQFHEQERKTDDSGGPENKGSTGRGWGPFNLFRVRHRADRF